LIPKRILITGASGLVGAELTANLMKGGHQVAHLGRTKRQGNVPSYTWDVDKGYIEEGALQGIDSIIHLAGAGIADKPWTARRKQEVLESRTRSSTLLYQTLKNTQHQVKSFISASAIGYYGFGGSEEVFTESSKAGTDFLADVVKAWEHEVDRIQELNIRIVKIRIGIVLSNKGGALKEIAKPVRWGAGAPLGNGKQPMSWIHIDDLCAMFRYAVENENLIGAYNGVAPQWSSNREVTRAIAKALHRPLLLPPVPSFVMKLMLGEMANLVLLGSKVSSEKIQQTGFKFQFEDLTTAIESFYRK